MKKKQLLLLAVLLLVALAGSAATVRNPVLFADYSDPDVVRVGDDYYLVASSFQCVPGLPILHSRDLAHWTIVGHAVERLPAEFDRAQHGNGIWAPSIRHHDGWFWIFFGDPDRGIYRTRARDVRGPWEPLTLVREARGWIDPSPLWDDDGSMYLVHAWAKSRAGFNGVLTMRRMSADGSRVLDDEGVVVFDGRERHPTIEGPKLYKRNGWYYIFAPAGGVKRGWQTVLRSKNVFGPYEDKIVLEQGSTRVNGPHQGAWVEGADGKSWFLHFQDRGAYGRVVHLEPMTWLNEWPEIGEGGEPVAVVDLAGTPHPAAGHLLPSTRGEGQQRSPLAGATFVAPRPAGGERVAEGRVRGLDWQWHGNPSADWATWDGDALRLSAVPSASKNLWDATNLYLQKFSVPAFHASTRVDASSLRIGERTGLLVMGMDYAALTITRERDGLALRQVVNRDADREGVERESAVMKISGPIHLRVSVAPEAICRFSYSTDGSAYKPLGSAFVARPGRWIGAKVGLFASAPAGVKNRGHASFASFDIELFTPTEAASLIVAQDGSGDFRTIQEALDAIPADNDEYRTILIRNGTYREKAMIAKSYVALVGEDRERTRIEFAELRRNWRATHPDDYGAAVINIANGATDVVIANLTILNDYGRRNGGDDDHQFAIRAMETSNRIAVLDADVIADGGDTFSPWNSESGLSYASDSYFEGHVDFVCPRGWSYITNSRFFSRSATAGIWHDGSQQKDQKFVVRHSTFDGIADFPLGRNHRDAQFFLIDAEFSSNLADRAIYPAAAPNPRQWGERYYYANARRDAGAFSWFSDNLEQADGSPREEDITAEWTLGTTWRPATLPAVLPFAAIPQPEHGWRYVDPAGATLRWTPGRNAIAQRVYFGKGSTPEFRGEQSETNFATGPLEAGQTYAWRIDSVTANGVIPGKTWSFLADARDVRIALVGDSTVTEKSGWGRGFASNIASSAAVLQLARGGRSSKSYIAEGHWADALRRKPTHVLLQFGHNDVQGKGLDRETDLVTYRANLRRYVDDARGIGAKPILVTPLVRRNYELDGSIRSDLTERAEAVRQVANEAQVPLIDLHAKSIELSTSSMGPMKSDGTLDHTHLNAAGSALFGTWIAEEVRRAAPELEKQVRKKKLPPAPQAWSVRMADSVMKRTPDPMYVDANEAGPRWEYTPGLIMKAIFDVGQRTGDERYWKYAKAYYDGFISADGTIRGYVKDEYNIDRINAGKPLFLLYEKTKDEKYRKAIEQLRQQMREHPRTSEGGFWHKKRYPYQMWLDGLYMGAPFLAQYAKTFKEPALFDDVITQFVLMEKHARDAKTGLLYHGWDESRKQKWANPETGLSPEFWGRAMGWYAMGLVETLDYVPLDHPRRRELIAILQRLAEAITKVQDQSGLWWQVVDQGDREGNYLEASVSTMFSFALLKSARLGYIDAKYAAVGKRAYEGIIRDLIEIDKDGLMNIHRVCQVAGLGGDPEKGERYRDGTFQYYVTEKIRSNDPKAVGPFIFASLEMERK